MVSVSVYQYLQLDQFIRDLNTNLIQHGTFLIIQFPEPGINQR